MSRYGRRTIPVVLAFVSLLSLVWISPLNYYRHSLVGGRLVTPPPTYQRTIQDERNLPQHNLSLPFPEGRTGRYVKFSNQVTRLGWNNVLNDILLCSYLAWRAKRAYVFQEYTWKPEHYPWRTRKWARPRTPLSALIAGPTVGGNWEDTDPTPRSIREDHWPKVCPPEDTAVIRASVAKEPIRDADADKVLDYWLALLNESPKRCVEIIEKKGDFFPQIFDLWVASTPRILSIWPQFRDSPVSRLLQTSPLVKSAIERNEHLYFSPSSQDSPDRYANMMAIHVRRGDYSEACQGFFRWSSTFYQWNLLLELPDPLLSPTGGDSNKNISEREVLHRRRCFPTDEEIIAKIQDSKHDWELGEKSEGEKRKLTSLYVMTNAEVEWEIEFRARLFAEGWEVVTFSSDLVLDDEQIGVGMAIDMDIGRQTGVFIGNGWSSLTSNVVHRRLVDGKKPASIRFW